MTAMCFQMAVISVHFLCTGDGKFNVKLYALRVAEFATFHMPLRRQSVRKTDTVTRKLCSEFLSVWYPIEFIRMVKQIVALDCHICLQMHTLLLLSHHQTLKLQ
jgi:hypothetical protein